MKFRQELRIVKEQCPLIWKKITQECPDIFDARLNNYFECEYPDGNKCDGNYCKDCWERAIEE